MAGGYSVGIASETKAFKQGIETGVIDPLEDAQDALEDLGKAQGPEQLERALKDAQDETRDLERETKSAADAIEREYKDAYRKARQASDDGTGKMRTATQEVTQELGSNLGEAVSSIRGDLSELGQVGQDTLGGLAATLAGAGPAGIVGAAGLAAGAVGLGLVTAGMQEAAEKQERLKELAAEWAQAYMEAGSSILNTSQIVAKGQDIFGDPEQYDVAKQNAKNWGVEITTAVAAMSGSQTAIDEVSAAVQAQADALEANARGADNYQQNIEQATTGTTKAGESYQKGKTALDELTGSMSAGREAAGYMSQMLLDVVNSADSATTEVDELGNTVYTLPDGTQIMIDAETGQATQNLDRFKGDLDGVAETVVRPKVILDVDDSAWRWYQPEPKVARVIVQDPRGPAGGREVWQ